MNEFVVFSKSDKSYHFSFSDEIYYSKKAGEDALLALFEKGEINEFDYLAMKVDIELAENIPKEEKDVFHNWLLKLITLDGDKRISPSFGHNENLPIPRGNYEQPRLIFAEV